MLLFILFIRFRGGRELDGSNLCRPFQRTLIFHRKHFKLLWWETIIHFVDEICGTRRVKCTPSWLPLHVQSTAFTIAISPRSQNTCYGLQGRPKTVTGQKVRDRCSELDKNEIPCNSMGSISEWARALSRGPSVTASVMTMPSFFSVETWAISGRMTDSKRFQGGLQDSTWRPTRITVP